MQANTTSLSPATSPPSAAASLVGWTWMATDIQVGAAIWRLQCWNMPLEILVHFLSWNWSQTHQLISTIVTVVVTGMACIFEIDLLLAAHKTRDWDIVQLCLLSGHCCCSRKTCNTEAWTVDTIPQCWHTSHAFSSFSYMYFHNFVLDVIDQNIQSSVHLHQAFVVYFASTNLEEVGLKADTSTNMVFL